MNLLACTAALASRRMGAEAGRRPFIHYDREVRLEIPKWWGCIHNEDEEGGVNEEATLTLKRSTAQRSVTILGLSENIHIDWLGLHWFYKFLDEIPRNATTLALSESVRLHWLGLCRRGQCRVDDRG